MATKSSLAALAMRALLPGGAAPGPRRPAAGNVTQALTSPGGSAHYGHLCRDPRRGARRGASRALVGSLAREDGQEFSLFDGVNTMGRRPTMTSASPAIPTSPARTRSFASRAARAESDRHRQHQWHLPGRRTPPPGKFPAAGQRDRLPCRQDAADPPPERRAERTPPPGPPRRSIASALPDFDAPAPGQDESG